MAIPEGVTAGGMVAGTMVQSQAYAKQEAQVTMLKKSMDVQTDAVMTLLEGIAPVPASKLPANLGQNINTTA